MDVVEVAEELLADEDPQRALSACEERLESSGLHVERLPDAGTGALVARRGEAGLVLSGHVDVVPGGEDWTHPPFDAVVEDERLYGRGASDMRGPVACMLAAVEVTSDPVTVVLTTDEETTMDGARRLAGDGVLEGAPLVVVGEPTDLEVAAAGKGLLWARVAATGDRGHASTPRGEDGRGPSAPERLVGALNAVPERPLDLTHPDLGPATAAVTGLESEQTPFNVLAGTAEARIDCRFPPPGTPDDVLGALRSHMDLPREGLELEVAKREPAFMGDEAAAEAAVDVLGRAGVDSVVTAVAYASEAGHWQRAAPTVVCGPGSISRAHAPDEHVTLDELDAGATAYRALVEWGG